MALLKELGFIRTGLFKFNGSPTTHIQVNFDVVYEAQQKYFAHLEQKSTPEGATSPFVQRANGTVQRANGLVQKGESITRVTSETTSESTNNKEFGPESPSSPAPEPGPNPRVGKGRKRLGHLASTLWDSTSISALELGHEDRLAVEEWLESVDYQDAEARLRLLRDRGFSPEESLEVVGAL